MFSIQFTIHALVVRAKMVFVLLAILDLEGTQNASKAMKTDPRLLI